MAAADHRRLLGPKITAVARQWRRSADETLSEMGMTDSAGWCLVHIRDDGPTRQAELAEALGVTQPSLVRTLDRLQGAGLIHRVQHPKDKRSNLIGLTDAGEALVVRIEEKLEAVRDAILKDIPDEAVELTAGMLDLIGARMLERERKGRP
jgi:MarR family transcriptional regulator for hemolysin